MRLPSSIRHSRCRRQGGKLSNSLAAAIGLFLAAALTFALSWHRAAEPESATLIPEPIDLPAFSLTDGDGGRFTKASLAGRFSLVFFGFTHCPDVCPITLQQLASLRRRLAAEGGATVPDIVFVSVDPERDTLEAIRDYAAAFGDGVIGVRGSLEDIDGLASALGVFHARKGTGDDYDVEHSAAVLVIDDEARFSAVFSAPHDVEAMARDWPLITAARR